MSSPVATYDLTDPNWPQNPFGAAKPREAILANRLGKDELSVLQEELKKDRINVSC